MGKRLIIPGADFSADGIRTNNVVDVVLNEGGNMDFYFLPTSMTPAATQNVYPTPPVDAIKKSVSADSQVIIDGTFASFLFGGVSVNGDNVIPSGVKELCVNYDKVVGNMQKSFMSLDADVVDLRGMKFSNGAVFTCAFAHASIKELKMPDLYLDGDTVSMFYNFNSLNVYGTPDFSFIKKINSINTTFRALNGSVAYLGAPDTSELQDSASAFYQSKVQEIDLSGWDFSHISNCYNMFNSCPNLRVLHLDKWNNDLSGISENHYSGMFTNTPVLEKVFVTNCSSTVKTWLLARLNECTAGGSSSWSETTVDGKACLTHS